MSGNRFRVTGFTALGGFAVLASALAGCATLTEGTSQTLAMNVTPVDAQCTGWRDGKMVGIYYPAFQTMKVSKSKDALVILCNHYGYKDMKMSVAPVRKDWRIPLSDEVDYATGALNPYEPEIDIVMEKS